MPRRFLFVPLFLLWLSVTSNAQLTVTLQNVAATQAELYSWSVTTAASPSGLSIKMGHSSSMVISTNVTRAFIGTTNIVSGSVQLSNAAADTAIQLTHVSVLLQQQGPAGVPVLQRVPADCPCSIASLQRTQYRTLQPGGVLVCPFAAQLDYFSTSALSVIAQAQVNNAGLVSSHPSKAWLSLPVSSSTQLSAADAFTSSSSSSSSSGQSQGVLGLGRCAIATDTFESGGLFLAPTALADGVKLPPLGAGISSCEGSVQSVYKVTFGPFNSSNARCGTYKVMNVARLNPLGGSQPPITTSSLALVSLTGCGVTELTPTATGSILAPTAAAAATAGLTQSGSVWLTEGSADGTPVSSAAANSASPAVVPSSTAGSDSLLQQAHTTEGRSTTGAAPAPAPAPAAAAAANVLAAELPQSQQQSQQQQPIFPAPSAAVAGVAARMQSSGSWQDPHIVAQAQFPASIAQQLMSGAMKLDASGRPVPAQQQQQQMLPQLGLQQQQQLALQQQLAIQQQQQQPAAAARQAQVGVAAAGAGMNQQPYTLLQQQQQLLLQQQLAEQQLGQGTMPVGGISQGALRLGQQQHKQKPSFAGALAALAKAAPAIAGVGAKLLAHHQQQQQQQVVDVDDLSPEELELLQQQEQYEIEPAAAAPASQQDTTGAAGPGAVNVRTFWQPEPQQQQQQQQGYRAAAAAAPTPAPAAATHAPEEYFYTYEDAAPAATKGRRLQEDMQQVEAGATLDSRTVTAAAAAAGEAEAVDIDDAQQQQQQQQLAQVAVTYHPAVTGWHPIRQVDALQPLELAVGSGQNLAGNGSAYTRHQQQQAHQQQLREGKGGPQLHTHQHDQQAAESWLPGFSDAELLLHNPDLDLALLSTATYAAHTELVIGAAGSAVAAAAAAAADDDDGGGSNNVSSAADGRGSADGLWDGYRPPEGVGSVDSAQMQQQQQQQLAEHRRRLQALEPMIYKTRVHGSSSNSSSSSRVRRAAGAPTHLTGGTTAAAVSAAGNKAVTPGRSAAVSAAAAAPPATAAAQVQSATFVRFSGVQIAEGVRSYTWKPEVSVTPSSLTVPQGADATALQYKVRVVRTAQAPVSVLRGQVHISNSGSSVLRLLQIAVEVPAAGKEAWAFVQARCPSPAAVAAAGRAHYASPAVTSSSSSSSSRQRSGSGELFGLVPPRSQLSCEFELSLPAEAPATASLVARVVTEAGQELAAKPHSFKVKSQKQQQEQQLAAAGIDEDDSTDAGSSSSSSGSGLEVGACAVASDTFLSPDVAHGVLLPSQVPAVGQKAPAAGSSTGSSSGGSSGVLVCDSAAWSYSVTVGPFHAGLCGAYKVVSVVRVVPTNSSTPSSSSSSTVAAAAVAGQVTAVAAADITVSQCSAATTAAAPMLSAAAAAAAVTGQSSMQGPILALPILSLGPVQLSLTLRSAWTVTSSPGVKSLQLRYDETTWASFMVQYSHQPGPVSYSLSGTLSIKNPNLLESLNLVKVSVDLALPGGLVNLGPGSVMTHPADKRSPGMSDAESGPATGVVNDGQAVVSCPRDGTGAVVVEGQFIGSGTLLCTWQLTTTADSALGSILQELSQATHPSSSSSSSSSIGVKLLASAITSAGREAASVPVPLSTAVAAGTAPSSNSSSSGLTIVSSTAQPVPHEGACAALSATFLEGSADEIILLNPHRPALKADRARGKNAVAASASGHRQGRKQHHGQAAHAASRQLVEVEVAKEDGSRSDSEADSKAAQQQQHKHKRMLLQGSLHSRLAGEHGGGEASDVVCESTTLSYAAQVGPFGPKACGGYKAVHLATASPTTGPPALAAASSNVSITVTGCPGAVAAVTVSDMQLQLLQPVVWNVTSQTAVDPSLGALQLEAKGSRDVEYSISYVAQPQPQVRQFVGTVTVANMGQDQLLLQRMYVEVMPLRMAYLGQPPFVLPVTCSLDSSSSSSTASSTDTVLPVTAVPGGTSIACSFEGPVPEGIVGPAAVTARAVHVDGSSSAGVPASCDLSQLPQQVVTSGARCAVVSDAFVGGRGRLVPQHSSRPAAAAGPTHICSSQTVSFVASLALPDQAACGKKLWVVNYARVTPIASRAVSSKPSSSLAAFQVAVTCSTGS